MKETVIGKLKKVVLYGMVLVIMVAVVYCKRDYYMDELLSFSLADNETGWMRVVDGTVYNPEQLYRDELMPQEGHRFDYAMVWENQTTDVHPPLYYALLHTVCSIMPGKVSKWLPAVINFVFALLTMYVMQRLLALFADGETDTEEYGQFAIGASFVFAILPGTLNNVSFFRMYVMAMFLVAVIAYICTSVIKSVYTQKEIGFAIWMALLVTEVLSALTHYYIVMYLVFAIGVLVLLLLVNRRWKDAAFAIVASAVAAGAAIAIFPTMLEHIFSGYRGEQSAENLQEITASTYLSQLMTLFTKVNKELWGGLLIVLLAVAVVMLVYRLRVQSNQTGVVGTTQSAVHESAAMLSMLLVPCVCYFLLLSAIAVEVTTRYMFPIYAVLYTGVMVLVWKGMQSLGRYRLAIMAGILVLTMGLAHWQADWRYLYRNDPLRAQLAEHTGTSAVVVYDAEWKCVELFRQLSDVDQVCYITQDEYTLLAENGMAGKDELLVFATSEEDITSLQKELHRNAALLGTHSDFVVYDFSR